MIIKYDEETAILTILLSETAHVTESDEESPGVIVDYDENRNVIGLEILRASRRMSDPRLLRYADMMPVALPAAA